jgi:two-component system, LytTR family, response regulator
MQQYKILIADDELLARQAIKLALPAGDDIQVVAECSDGEEAIGRIRQYLPEIVFLDIQMPLLTGFEVLKSLPENYFPYLVIVSAHDNYALEAYENDAADYLLKPFTQQRFDKVFLKAKRHAELNSTQKYLPVSAPFNERMAALTGSYRSRINIKDGVRTVIVPCEDVLFMEATGDYVTINTARKKYLHSETLTALEKSLDPAVFVRTHRSFIVNINFIKELNSHYNGDYTVVLQNGSSLKLSRNYRELLRQRIN